MAKGEITAQEGSFPLTRGKRGLVQILSSPRRLIPAHAGKTMPPTASLEAHRAHPRSRGENVGDFASGPGGQGSSPLTRGKRANAHRGFLTVRLIPAHAGKTWSIRCMAFCGPAHPRSRGENISAPASTPSMRGSSPLTRGKLDLVRTQVRTIGLIPAHAGKTRPGMPTTPSRPAHPRSRGENFQAKTIPARGPGSSPLTRGKRERRRDPIAGARLIPAHAGKTRPGMPTTPSRPAHPRSRGENFQAKTIPARGPGSSPLTRGKRERRRDPIAGARLIPAHAGKTLLRALGAGACAAHPRSRGENSWGRGVHPRQGGSSPLTRGKRAQAQQGHLHVRLIPAHAGKTGRPYLGLPRPQAHPRSRGENRTEDLLVLLQLGSSPLTRGKRLRALSNKELQGLIPAHAGKTLSACRCYAGSPAHPRSRGENEGTVDKELSSKGSSPLTRGKRTTHSVPRKEHGLIPAHAGKTTPHTDHTPHTRAHPRSRGENSLVYPATESCSGSSPLTRGKRRDPVRPRVLGRLIPAHAGKTPRAHAHASSSRAHPRSRGENSR